MIITNPIERKNDLLKQLKDKSITHEQFTAACVSWLMEPTLWNDIVVKYEPPPPQIKEWQDYINMSKYDKAKVSEGFFRIPEIESYLKAKSHAFSWNIGMYGWLKEQKAIIPDTKENLAIHQRIDVKIYTFKQWVKQYAPDYMSFEEAKQVVFDQGPGEVGELATGALDTFGGQIL